MSGECQNPLCKAPLVGGGKKSKRTCGDKCRLTRWILKKAVSLLEPLGFEGAIKVLKEVSDGRF